MIGRCLCPATGAALVAVVAFVAPAPEDNLRRTDRAGNVVAVVAPVPNVPAPRGPAPSWQSHQSRDKLKRLAIAIHSYNDTHNRFPKDITDKDGKPLLSWRVAILPHLDLDFLYAQFKLDEPWDGPNNRKLAAFMPDVFRAPVQDRKTADTYYQAIAGPGTVFDPNAKGTLQDITDGTSQTLLLVEAGPPVPWTKPADIPFNPNGKPPLLEGPYTDAVHVAVADGSTFRMKSKPDPDDLTAFITRAGSEVFEMKNLRAAPAKPTTEEEKKQLADNREWAKGLLREAAGNAGDRFRVEESLRKLGALPQLDPAALATCEELDEIMKDVQERSWADRGEYHRLIEVLGKKDPKTAEQIRKDRRDRLAKEEAERD
jgi:hypothetical protein